MYPLRRKLESATRRAIAPFYGVIVGARTSEPVVALTFDDGPDPSSTPALLDVLAEHDARATFFMLGTQAQRHPELVDAVMSAGHEIGNHSWDHPSIPALPSRVARDQLHRTRTVLAPGGQALCRPPFGHLTLRSYWTCRNLGYTVIGWTVSGHDWTGADAQTIAARVQSRLRPGAIVLLHDLLYTYEDELYRDRGPTIEAVRLLLRELRQYEFVTVSELLGRGRPQWHVGLQRPDPAYVAALGRAR